MIATYKDCCDILNCYICSDTWVNSKWNLSALLWNNLLSVFYCRISLTIFFYVWVLWQVLHCNCTYIGIYITLHVTFHASILPKTLQIQILLVIWKCIIMLYHSGQVPPWLGLIVSLIFRADIISFIYYVCIIAPVLISHPFTNMHQKRF